MVAGSAATSFGDDDCINVTVSASGSNAGEVNISGSFDGPFFANTATVTGCGGSALLVRFTSLRQSSRFVCFVAVVD